MIADEAALATLHVMGKLYRCRPSDYLEDLDALEAWLVDQAAAREGAIAEEIARQEAAAEGVIEEELRRSGHKG